MLCRSLSRAVLFFGMQFVPDCCSRIVAPLLRSSAFCLFNMPRKYASRGMTAWCRSHEVASRVHFSAWSMADGASQSVKAKLVRIVMAHYMELAASQLKMNGVFKIVGCLKLKLREKPARPARKGVHPLTKKPCMFKAKPATRTVHVVATKKFNDMINRFQANEEWL